MTGCIVEDVRSTSGLTLEDGMSGHIRVLRLHLLASSLLLLGVACGPLQAHRPEPGMESDERAVTDMPLRELGQLQVFITGQMTDGRNIMLRGLVRNPYPETVDGVRVLFRMLSAPGAEGRELDRMQKVLDVKLASGEQTGLRWDIQTMYAGPAGGGFQLLAFAVKRGDETLPPPPEWRE